MKEDTFPRKVGRKGKFLEGSDDNFLKWDPLTF